MFQVSAGCSLSLYHQGRGGTSRTPTPRGSVCFMFGGGPQSKFSFDFFFSFVSFLLVLLLLVFMCCMKAGTMSQPIHSVFDKY